jgi:hypothetical protein
MSTGTSGRFMPVEVLAGRVAPRPEGLGLAKESALVNPHQLIHAASLVIIEQVLSATFEQAAQRVLLLRRQMVHSKRHDLIIG